MIAFRAEDIKDFMSKVLVKNTFDKFYLQDGELETFTSFRFGGALNMDFYSSDEQEALGGRRMPLWSELKPVVYQLVRGKKLPLAFKLVFALSDENVDWLLDHNKVAVAREHIGGLYLNIRYDHKTVTCVTGTSFKTFMMDKTLEQLWDAAVLQFMKQNEIVIEKM